MKLYKKDIAPELWKHYLSLTKAECMRDGITFSEFNDPNPYVDTGETKEIRETEEENHIWFDYRGEEYLANIPETTRYTRLNYAGKPVETDLQVDDKNRVWHTGLDKPINPETDGA